MPSRISLFRSGALPVLFGCAVLFTACGSKFQRHEENLVRNQMHGAEDAPEWVRGSIPSTDADLAFVGRIDGHRAHGPGCRLRGAMAQQGGSGQQQRQPADRRTDAGADARKHAQTGQQR